jgi:hypothetical protein
VHRPDAYLRREPSAGGCGPTPGTITGTGRTSRGSSGARS